MGCAASLGSSGTRANIDANARVAVRDHNAAFNVPTRRPQTRPGATFNCSRSACHDAVQPASAAMMAPLMWRDSPEARKRASAAMSSGSSQAGRASETRQLGTSHELRHQSAANGSIPSAHSVGWSPPSAVTPGTNRGRVSSDSQGTRSATALSSVGNPAGRNCRYPPFGCVLPICYSRPRGNMTTYP
jgi:hypothetical protein